MYFCSREVGIFSIQRLANASRQLDFSAQHIKCVDATSLSGEQGCCVRHCTKGQERSVKSRVYPDHEPLSCEHRCFATRMQFLLHANRDAGAGSITDIRRLAGRFFASCPVSISYLQNTCDSTLFF